MHKRLLFAQNALRYFAGIKAVNSEEIIGIHIERAYFNGISVNKIVIVKLVRRNAVTHKIAYCTLRLIPAYEGASKIGELTLPANICHRPQIPCFCGSNLRHS